MRNQRGKPLWSTHPKDPCPCPKAGAGPASIPFRGSSSQRAIHGLPDFPFGIRRTVFQTVTAPSSAPPEGDAVSGCLARGPDRCRRGACRFRWPKPLEWALLHRSPPRRVPRISPFPAASRLDRILAAGAVPRYIRPKADDSNRTAAEAMVQRLARRPGNVRAILPLGRPKASLQPYQAFPRRFLPTHGVPKDNCATGYPVLVPEGSW
jgi:hypothetical protein